MEVVLLSSCEMQDSFFKPLDFSKNWCFPWFRPEEEALEDRSPLAIVKNHALDNFQKS